MATSVRIAYACLLVYIYVKIKKYCFKRTRTVPV